MLYLTFSSSCTSKNIPKTRGNDLFSASPSCCLPQHVQLSFIIHYYISKLVILSQSDLCILQFINRTSCQSFHLPCWAALQETSVKFQKLSDIEQKRSSSSAVSQKIELWVKLWNIDIEGKRTMAFDSSMPPVNTPVHICRLNKLIQLSALSHVFSAFPCSLF